MSLNPFPAVTLVDAIDVVQTVTAAVVEIIAPDAYAVMAVVDVAAIEIIAPDVTQGPGLLHATMYARSPGLAGLTDGYVEEPPGVTPFVPGVNPLPPDPEEIVVPLPPWEPSGEYRD